MKECSKCGLEKADHEFGSCAAREDGLQSYCIVCMRKYRELRTKKKPEGWVRKTADLTAYHREYRRSHPEYYREKEKKKYERQMKALHGPGYVVGDPGNMKGGKPSMQFVGFLTDEDRARQKRAGKRVYTALKNGTLVKTPCEVCGELKVEAHHPDYDAPLAVVWLCKKHHLECHLLTHVRVQEKC